MIFKVSNTVEPRRREILQGISGQSWCYSSDWCSYSSRWFGVPEVLHLPSTRSWNSCSHSLDPEFWQKCHIPPKDSVLEEGTQLRVRRVQLPHVDRIYCHISKSSHFLDECLWWMRPFQLSYKPLGEPDPRIFYLGVAVLLVCSFRIRIGFDASLTCQYIFSSCLLSPSLQLSMRLLTSMPPESWNQSGIGLRKKQPSSVTVISRPSPPPISLSET